MLIGYARVSTTEQNLRLQIDALTESGCEKIFSDEGISGAAVFKPKLTEALHYARSGKDTLVVWKLDRLGRSMRDLIEAVENFQKHGIGFRSLKESDIDTTTPTGSLIFHVFGAIAQYERGTNHERTMAGIASSRAAGTVFGRPRAVGNQQWTEAKKLFETDPPSSVASVAKLLGTTRQTVYRLIERDNAKAAVTDGIA